MRPRIVISCGDINGIGIECLLGALRSRATSTEALRSSPLPADIALCIDADLFSQVMRAHNLEPLDIELIPINASAVVQPGVCAADAGAVAIASLNVAVSQVTSGAAHAVVTLPISKDACRQAGWPYPGHTEMLAEHAGGEALMLLCFEGVRVGLATAHVPLKYVADSLSQARIEERVQAVHHTLTRDFRIAAPRIAVLGLNPHAGEEGLIGHEEQRIIIPAINALRSRGINAEGPFPADGFFAFGAYKSFDGILAMYHDQGLIPLKLLAQGGGVNVTANLNIVRTSPDHGTAFDKAGRNIADSASTAAALSLAIDIVNARNT